AYSIQISNAALLIDVKTLEQLALDKIADKNAVEPTTPPTTTPTTPVDTTPTTLNYKNSFSQKKQYIVSNAVGNIIKENVYYYEDAGTYFEFSFGTKNQVGSKYIPNASAELITDSGKTYIEIVIKNLSQEVFKSYGITGTALTHSGINLSNANFVRIDLKSFSGGTATYRMQIKRAADFRLLSEATVDGATQVVSI